LLQTYLALPKASLHRRMARLRYLASSSIGFCWALSVAAGGAEEEWPAAPLPSSVLEAEGDGNSCALPGPLAEARRAGRGGPPPPSGLSLRQLRGLKTQAEVALSPKRPRSREDDVVSSDASAGKIKGRYMLYKRYNFSKDPHEDFEVVSVADENMTHSCAEYVDDGSTVFSRDGKLVLKVASQCPGGVCLHSGRVMSKRAFKYGLFTFSATVPKCNYIWPALWLLPHDTAGNGVYGPWPCSGEIDVLETVHGDAFAAFNVVAGFGSTGGPSGYCTTPAQPACNACAPPAYCTSTTYKQNSNTSWYAVEPMNCSIAGAHPSWSEHTFVLSWQPGQMITWVDPVLSYDEEGHLVSVEPRLRLQSGLDEGLPAFKAYEQKSTPTWRAVEAYMQRCFQDTAASDAPFDQAMKLVLNIAIGGYGGAPCSYGAPTCGSTCGAAVGSEMVLSDISVWELM